MSEETKDSDKNVVPSGDDSAKESDSGQERAIPFETETDKPEAPVLDGNDDKEELSREQLLSKVEELSNKNKQLEDSRRSLQSSRDVLTEQIVKNAQEAARLGLTVDGAGTIVGKESKEISTEPSDLTAESVEQIMDRKLRSQKKVDLEEQMRRDVIKLYPDLEDPASDLYKEAERVLAERPHLNSASALRDIAELSVLNLMKSNKPEIEKQMREKFFTKEAQSAAFATASAGATSVEDDSEGLTEQQRSYYKKQGRQDAEMKRIEKVMRKRNKEGAFIINV